MAKIIINAGHTLSGKGTGAIGYINESEETRKVVNAVKMYLTGKGHEVIVANVDEAEDQATYLYGVARKANKHTDADLFVSIHFNSFNGKASGTECFTWKGARLPQARGVCEELGKLGFKNRGVKDGSHLYVISKTAMPALLIEVCFVDSLQDYSLYKKHGVNVVAQAITRGLLYR